MQTKNTNDGFSHDSKKLSSLFNNKKIEIEIK